MPDEAHVPTSDTGIAKAFHDEVPTLYDLVLNTDMLRVEQVVDAVVAVAQHTAT